MFDLIVEFLIGVLWENNNIDKDSLCKNKLITSFLLITNGTKIYKKPFFAKKAGIW